MGWESVCVCVVAIVFQRYQSFPVHRPPHPPLKLLFFPLSFSPFSLISIEINALCALRRMQTHTHTHKGDLKSPVESSKEKKKWDVLVALPVTATSTTIMQAVK